MPVHAPARPGMPMHARARPSIRWFKVILIRSTFIWGLQSRIPTSPLFIFLQPRAQILCLGAPHDMPPIFILEHDHSPWRDWTLDLFLTFLTVLARVGAVFLGFGTFTSLWLRARRIGRRRRREIIRKAELMFRPQEAASPLLPHSGAHNYADEGRVVRTNREGAGQLLRKLARGNFMQITPQEAQSFFGIFDSDAHLSLADMRLLLLKEIEQAGPGGSKDPGALLPVRGTSPGVVPGCKKEQQQQQPLERSGCNNMPVSSDYPTVPANVPTEDSSTAISSSPHSAAAPPPPLRMKEAILQEGRGGGQPRVRQVVKVRSTANRGSSLKCTRAFTVANI